MANAQLISYIKQQVQLGESETPIRNSLLSVGWAEGDINDAFKDVGGSASSSGAPVSSTVSPMVSPTVSQVSKPTVQSFEPRKVININNLDSASSGREKIFDPKAVTSVSENSFASQKSSRGLLISAVGLGILSAALVALGGFLYVGKSSAETKMDQLSQQVSALGSQAASLTKNGNDLQARVAELVSLNGDLVSQLALFHIVPVGTSTPTVSVVTLKGDLISGYAVITSKGIRVTIKNSKESRLDLALKPFVGTSVEITGTTVPGSREISVTAVNGIEITSPQAAGAMP